MTKAYVLLNTELGKEKDLYKELKSFPNVLEVFRTYGTYDLIVQVEEQDSTFLKELIFHRIRKLDGVKQTITLMIT